MLTTPTVTCVCVTKNRRVWLPKAIGCFLAQTYENKNLLIVADGDYVGDIVPNDPRIVFAYDKAGFDSIGSKRNFACGLAGNSDIFVTWDDDDWSAPARIEDQVMFLMNKKVAMVGYHNMKFTDGDGWWMYEGLENVVGIGTSLCFWKEWWVGHPFPNMNVSEDDGFARMARETGEFATVSASAANPRRGVEPTDMMYATIHRDNTSPRDHIMKSHRRLA